MFEVSQCQDHCDQKDKKASRLRLLLQNVKHENTQNSHRQGRESLTRIQATQAASSEARYQNHQPLPREPSMCIQTDRTGCNLSNGSHQVLPLVYGHLKRTTIIALQPVPSPLEVVRQKRALHLVLGNVPLKVVDMHESALHLIHGLNLHISAPLREHVACQAHHSMT